MAVQVVTAEQAAVLLDISPASVVELADRGEIPGNTVGGRWRFCQHLLVAPDGVVHTQLQAQVERLA
jgi:excisionase family DNA binding protein